AEALLELAKGDASPSQIEAVRSLGRLNDQVTKAYLVSLLRETDGLTKQLAVTALAGRSLEDEELTASIVEETNSGDVAIAAAALQGLIQRSPALGLEKAVAALSSDKYYLVNRAITLLASLDEGRSVLTQFAAENAETRRGLDAEQALDPAQAALGEARPTANVETLTQYQGAKLKLVTSRGNILIEMLPEAAYAATSFLQLADAGKMDNMLWHRVIPNFVAQAGQTENLSVNDWGTIREEWFAADHKIGTVGLATIGKDTGSTQFFINTAYNLHLNGRYTVFGKVTEGLDVAMALREGDLIVKAEVIAATE
ncbi:MAG: peptidylprolyl isomerase, partial [Kordiimonas sp.]